MKNTILFIALLTAGSGAVAQHSKKHLNQADWQQRTDHTITAFLDENRRFLQCEESLNYVNNSPHDLHEIWFHIWPNAFRNNRTHYGREAIANGNNKFFNATEEESGFLDSLNFKVNGVAAGFEFDAENTDIIKLRLPSVLKSGDSVQIYTPFRVKIPWLFSRMGYNNNLYSITQWYPKPAVYDVNGWNTFPYAEQGEYYSEFGSYKVNLNVPADWRIAATGVLKTDAERSWLDSLAAGNVLAKRAGRKQLQFEQNRVGDFAWFAHPSFKISKGKTKLSEGKEVVTWAFFGADTTPKKGMRRFMKSATDGQKIIESIDKALTYYSKRVGEYPYEYCTVVIGELQGAGGMEYPMITICADASEGTIIHEVGHNWFQGMLGSQEREHPWMDESINTFYQNQAEGKETEELSPGDRFKPNGSYAGFRLSHDFGCYQSGNLHSEKYTSINYGTIVYGINPQRFLYLQEYLGRRKMDSCMKTYFRKWQYRHPLPGDLQRTFETVSGQKLNWFFDGLLGGSAPDVAISSVKKSKKKGNLIKVNNKSNYDLPVKLQWRTGSQKNYIWISGDTLVRLNQKMEQISLNATGFLPESNLANNDANNKGIFRTWGKTKFGFPNLYKRGENRVWFFPWFLSGNRYDGFTPGMLFSNISFPRRNWEWWAMPLYGMKSKDVVGIAGIRRTIYHKKGPFNSSEILVNYRRFNFNPRFTTAYNRGAVKATVYFKRNNPWIKSSLDAELIAIRMDNTRQLKRGKDSLGNETITVIEDVKYYESDLFKLTYVRDYTKKLSPARIKIGFMYGGNAGSLFGGNTFNKGQFILGNVQAEKFIPYVNKNKKTMGLFLKSYVSGMSHNFMNGSGRFVIPVSAPQGPIDFDFSRVQFARSASFGSNSGIWSNVLLGDMNGVRMFTNLPTSNWVAGLTLQSGLIPRLPIKAFFDLAYSPDLVLTNDIFYAGGLCFSQTTGINNNLEIAMPLFYSKVFKDFLNVNPKIQWYHLISIKMNLNLNDPFSIVRNVLN